MLTAYIEAAMHRATYEILSEGGTFYGEISGSNGVFARAEIDIVSMARPDPADIYSSFSSKRELRVTDQSQLET